MLTPKNASLRAILVWVKAPGLMIIKFTSRFLALWSSLIRSFSEFDWKNSIRASFCRAIDWRFFSISSSVDYLPRIGFIDEGSIADLAGLKKGDIILGVNSNKAFSIYQKGF